MNRGWRQSFKREIIRCVGIVLALDAIGVGIVICLRLIAGPGAFSRYLRTVTCHALSAHDGICLLLSVTTAALVYELICRWLIQRGKMLRGRAAGIGIAGCTLSLGIVYLHFGWPLAVAGAALGAAAAVVYRRTTSRLGLILWHTQWAVLGVLATIGLAVFFDGEARRQYLWAYKQKNIRDGALYYRDGWGWVDNSHYHKERLHMLLKKIRAAAPGEQIPVTIHEPFVTVSRRWLPVERLYRITDVPTEDPMEQWALASSITIHFSCENEKAQASVPSWYCSQMSAWQFDDLPSTLLTCLDYAPGAELNGKEIRDIPTLLKRWEVEGDRLVRGSYCELRLPPGASALQVELFRKIGAARKRWQYLGVGDGDFTKTDSTLR